MGDVQQLATAAHQHFTNKEYDAALEVLEKVRQLKDDPRIRHNMTVVSFYRDGCANPHQLLETLSETKGNTQTDASTPNGEATKTDSAKSSVSEPESDNELTSLQNAYLSYNKAVIYFQLRQYSYSLELLEALFPNIEALPEDLAIKACFLLIDVYHLFKQSTKIANIIAHLEKNFSNQRGEGTGAKGSGDSASQGLSLQNTSFSTTEFNLLLQLYKLRSCVATKEFTQAKRLLKSAAELLRHITATPSVYASLADATFNFLKANVEYARGNYTKALKLLEGFQKKISSEGEVAIATLNNDKACIYYRLQKHSAASFYVSKALKDYLSGIVKDKDRKKAPSIFAQEKRDELYYNQGLQLLLTGKPELAFKCFEEATKTFYRKPRLWLRIAECCIVAHLQQRKGQSNKNYSCLIRQAVVHEDKTRHIILPTASTFQTEQNTEKTLSLEYGQECLRNALFLLSRASAQNVKEATKSEPKAAEQETTEAATSQPEVTSDKRLHLREACLLNSAFIALCMEDPVVAHSAATEIISNSNSSSDARFLAHIYAAEALCLLNRPTEAAAHLSPSVLALKNAPATTPPLSPRSSASSPIPQAISPTDARYTLHINLACVHILQDKIPQAQKCLSQAIALCPTRHEGILLLVYIELCKGNTGGALEMLKRGRSAGLLLNAALLNNSSPTPATPSAPTIPNVKTAGNK